MKLVIFAYGINRKEFLKKKLEENGFTVNVRHLLGLDFAVETEVKDLKEAYKIANLVGLDEEKFELSYHEN